ncbi:DUF2867 domain-containing protein [Candidatus Marinamargulisbacteria bacterium SCGC AG-410-N11]|nr:DUF2867 domain-containing protein [Candidatus Marinamargulisbacteria bacterium SCGC AG-410-N11]
MKKNKILVTGSSGYVGGRLINYLANQQYLVRCTARRPHYIEGRFPSSVDVVKCDATSLSDLMEALKQIDVAFYMIHSLGTSDDKFEKLEELCAQNFAKAAQKNGVKKIVYLGGIIAKNQESNLSSHMRSRLHVGDILRQSGIPVITLRASIIIGSGSLSFEICRSLCERLPVMIVPKWVTIEAQPIAIDDVIKYLYKSIELNLDKSMIFDIGCPQKTSYLGLMETYIRLTNKKRFILRFPFLSLRLSSYWLALITPVYSRIGRKLIESLRNPTIVERKDDTNIFGINPMTLQDAINIALVDKEETHWASSLSSTYSYSNSTLDYSTKEKIFDTYSLKINAPDEKVFSVIQRIGGNQGWYFANTLWKIRAFIDSLIGGPGFRRKRRDEIFLKPGDIVDWWRVEKIENKKNIHLRAEMKLPGRAWLYFEIKKINDTQINLEQTAIFLPFGILGYMYWYILYPIHWIIFQGMCRHIKKRSEKNV